MSFNKVIVYVRMDIDDERFDERFEMIKSYCSILGLEPENMYFEYCEDASKQKKLDKALGEMWKLDMPCMVTIDFMSLTPDLAKSMDIAESVQHEGGYIHFIDAESVIKEYMMWDEWENPQNGVN